MSEIGEEIAARLKGFADDLESGAVTRRLDNTQDVFTPDANSVEGPVHCGVCNELMGLRRDCHGPTSFMGAMAGVKRKYDFFWCQHRDEPWHKQVAALRREAATTVSGRLEKMLLEEAEEVLATRQTTKS